MRGFFKEINAAGQTALHGYGRFVGDRFKDLPNIVWMLGGDYAFPPSLRWLGDQLAAGLREGGAGQVITAHGGQTSAVETFGDRSWLGMDTVYTYARRPAAAASGRASARAPRGPSCSSMSTYDGRARRRSRARAQAGVDRDALGRDGPVLRQQPDVALDGPTLFPFTGDWRTALDGVSSRDMTRLGALLPRAALARPAARSRRIASSAAGGPPAARAVAATTAGGRLLGRLHSRVRRWLA